jgi:hypothetical protein
LQIRIIDKGAGELAATFAAIPVSLALKGAILGELLDQRLLDSSGNGIFQCEALRAASAGQYVVELGLGRAGEVFVTAMRALGESGV